MSDGWIKLHRKIREHPLLRWHPLRRFVFEEVLLTAQHSDRRIERGGKIFDIKRGQSVVSSRYLARMLKVDHKTITKILRVLESDHTFILETSPLGTIVTVCNWEEYQVEKVSESPPAPHLSPHLLPTSSPHNKNEEELKNESNKKDSVPSGLVETAAPSPTSARPHKAIAEKMVQVFNHHLGDTLSRARVTPRRVRTLSIALKDDFADDGAQWSAFCQRVAASDFLTGRKTDWRASLDWIIKPANRTKILEGNYDNRENGNDIAARAAQLLADELDDQAYEPPDEFDGFGEGYEPYCPDPAGDGDFGDGQGLLEIPYDGD